MRVLTVNAGSSSIKFAVFSVDGDIPTQVLSGKIDHVGLPEAGIMICYESGEKNEESFALPDMRTAEEKLLERLEALGALHELDAVAHRVVHGAHFKTHTKITPAVLAELRRMVPYDPDHMPAELSLIEVFQKRVPQAVQIACFDTVFFSSLPEEATLLPIPRRYFERGVRKYGFHGLSYTSICEQLTERGKTAGRTVIAHLGNGVSLAALRDGVPVDTTMSFSPNSGVPMGTRSGDIDPGVVRFMAKEEGKSLEEIDELLSKQSGLYGMSGISYDMYELLKREETDTDAAVTISVFTRKVKEQIGAYASVLDGIDALVFTGGMGAASAPIREKVTSGLGFLGIELDQGRNQQNEPVISPDSAQVTVYALTTDEEHIMATVAASFITSH